MIIDKVKFGKKWNGTLKIIRIAIQHLQMNQILPSNKPWGVDMPLNWQTKQVINFNWKKQLSWKMDSVSEVQILD